MAQQADTGIAELKILQIKIDHGHNLLMSEGQILVHCLPSKPTVNSECQADT